MVDISDGEHARLVRARLAAATPGPWRRERESMWDWSVNTGEPGTESDDYMGVCPDCGTRPSYDEGDADLIANAPADLERLLNRCGMLEQRVRLLRDRA